MGVATLAPRAFSGSRSVASLRGHVGAPWGPVGSALGNSGVVSLGLGPGMGSWPMVHPPLLSPAGLNIYQSHIWMETLDHKEPSALLRQADIFRCIFICLCLCILILSDLASHLGRHLCSQNHINGRTTQCHTNYGNGNELKLFY